MNIIVYLSGWADGLMDNPKKVEFPIQMALYNVFKDCDWNIKTKIAFGSVVYEPFKIDVVAKRCHSRSYPKKGNPISHYTIKKFSIIVSEYTLANVYQQAIKTLVFLFGTNH
jgi:hypothetical protein